MFRKKINYLDRKLLPFVMVFLIGVYRFLSSALFRKRICRFYPSCSEYSKQAFKKKGFLKGFILSFKRILKCHPFNPGGIDFL